MRDVYKQTGASVALPVRSRPRDATRAALQQVLSDFLESCHRVARKTHWPTREGLLRFFGDQVVLNGVSWTAGLLAARFVKNFFEVRGFQNLWGLLAPQGRTLVSAEDYQLIVTVASYSAGLLMLIFVRHLVVRVLTEFTLLRFERARDKSTI